jgi:hypothetical protein
MGMIETTITDLGRVSHLDAVLATIGPVDGFVVADIGCGEGALDRALAAHGAIVTGYDPFIAPAEPMAAGTGSYQLVCATADAIPAPDASVDLVLFVFSLHHVPEAKLAGAMAEARRLLRRDGQLYVAEPVAEGPHQYIVELFHDETAVRRAASAALAREAAPRFAEERVLTYIDTRSYADFADFSERMIANQRFNGYTSEAVLAPAVRRRFDEICALHHGTFDQPVRINLFGAGYSL